MLLDFFVPGRCAGCSAAGAVICAGCEAAIATMPALLLPARSGLPPITAIGPHQGALRSMILALKFRGARQIGVRLGRWLAPKLLLPFDVIVPVPLYDRALHRSRATATQSTLPLAARSRNVAGAFAPGRDAAALRGARVLLVDDVVTTGTTVAACAFLLRTLAARSVSVGCGAVRLSSKS